MIKTTQQIIEDIRTHMQKRGGEYGDWFVGVGTDAVDCLFNAHHVLRKGDRWILRRAASPAAAREVLDYFLNILSADCAVESELTATADSVYAYRKAAHTQP